MSLKIKISRNGLSNEYLFNKLGPILIGSDERCDLRLEDACIEPKMLEVKVSGGNIFIKEIGARSQIYLDSVILPFREEVRYVEGSSITLKDTNYQITILKKDSDAFAEPPPFFEGEFRERLDRMNFKIREKETELKHLSEKEDKKKTQIGDLEDRYHRFAREKGKLEVEVDTLKTQKETLSTEIRKAVSKNHDVEDKIVQLKDFVKRLEEEERNLKDTIVAQNMVLVNLKEEREKKTKDVDRQRILLANLELDTLKAREELSGLKAEFENQEQEIQVESGKIAKILNSSHEAMKEGVKIQNHIAQALKEKALLDHEVKELQEKVNSLETQRSEAQNNLLDLKAAIEHEEEHSRKIQSDIERHKEEETNLKVMNGEVRAELSRVEEKLTSRKNQLNQIEFQEQDVVRKLSTINFELERSSLKLKELISEEKAQELKVLALREEFNQVSIRTSDEKKALHKSMDEERSKLQLELQSLQKEIETEKKNLAETESQKALTEVVLEEVRNRERQIKKEKSGLETEVTELKKQKTHIEAGIADLKNETIRIQHEKDKAQRDLNSLQLKLQECEGQIRESLEEAKVEVENFKRDERARLQAEKDVYLAEVEAFRQKSLIEVENEYRRKEDDLHQKKHIALKEADEILREARRTENIITEEANKRLREATLDAQEREKNSHQRIREAQEYFKEKEREADAIIQKSRMESRDLIKRTEMDLMDDLAKRKAKIKKFLTMKQENGILHIQNMSEQHQLRLKRSEEKAQEKLEEIKRKELKKVAKLLEEEHIRQNELKEIAMKEVKEHKDKAMKEVNDMRIVQENELAEKKKYMLDHINQQKYRTQESWQQEIKKEREEFIRTKKERISNATSAVMNVFISEAGPQGEKEQQLRDKIKSTLEMAIDGQSADALKEVDQILDFNPTKRKKVLPVLKKYALRFGIPAAVATIILADIGNIRTNVVTFTKDLIQQQQSASEIYVNQQKTEWKEKHTYTPQTTPEYKATYTDNVIYTTDFEKVMENEEFQNDWILKLHDYMVKDLELSEDVAISFISSEGSLVKELGTLRKDLHPQHLDVGLKKMNDSETTHLGWLKEKITDPEKMAKFVSFRKDFYEKFHAEKFAPQRNLATETEKK